MNAVLRFLMRTALAAIVLAAGTGSSGAQTPSLQDIAKAAEAGAAPRGLVIFEAREIVTFDPARPSAKALIPQLLG
jgi:hypothetical protein